MGHQSFSKPELTLLDPGRIQQFHRAACSILEKTGLNVHHPAMRSKMAAAGCRLHDGVLVTIPAKLVDAALGTAKHEVVIHDRDGAPVMPLGPHQIYFGTGSDLVNTLDAETQQRRPSTLEDAAQSARLCDALEEIDFLMSFALPGDIPQEDIEPRQYYAMVSNSTKPVIMTSYSGLLTLERQHRMACLIAGGDRAFRQKPNTILYSQFVSPLQHDRGAVNRLVFCADHEIPLIYVPTIMPGASGPITMAGSLALAVAECLAGLVMHQLQRPGAPFIFGACVSPLDMRTMIFPYGSPEWRLNDMVMAELSRFYGLPVFGTGGAADSKLVDAQAGTEYASSLLPAALAGTNLIHDVGYLESGLTGSLESIVLGADQIRWVKQFMAGLEFSGETLGLDVIDEVGPAGSFLGHKHTVKHLRRTIWKRYAIDRYDHSAWETAGSKDYATVAREHARELIRTHQPKPLDAGLDASLRELI